MLSTYRGCWREFKKKHLQKTITAILVLVSWEIIWTCTLVLYKLTHGKPLFERGKHLKIIWNPLRLTYKKWLFNHYYVPITVLLFFQNLKDNKNGITKAGANILEINVFTNTTGLIWQTSERVQHVTRIHIIMFTNLMGVFVSIQ